MIGAFNGFNIMPQGGPSMYEIGYNSGPGGNIANAIKGTIDKYHSTIASQQAQQDKMGLIKYEDQVKRPWMYDAAGNNKPFAPGTTGIEPTIRVKQVQLDPNDPDSVVPFTYSEEMDYTTGMPKTSTPVAAQGDVYKTKSSEQKAKKKYERNKNAAATAQKQTDVNAKLDALLGAFSQ
jgi:hypothetical protein